jgi:hypothetical protein
MECMQLMLSKKAKERGLVERPLATPRPSRSDHIPAHVRRAVMERSGMDRFTRRRRTPGLLHHEYSLGAELGGSNSRDAGVGTLRGMRCGPRTRRVQAVGGSRRGVTSMTSSAAGPGDPGGPAGPWPKVTTRMRPSRILRVR